jgi:hypothetical protein
MVGKNCVGMIFKDIKIKTARFFPFFLFIIGVQARIGKLAGQLVEMHRDRAGMTADNEGFRDFLRVLQRFTISNGYTLRFFESGIFGFLVPSDIFEYDN